MRKNIVLFVLSFQFCHFANANFFLSENAKRVVCEEEVSLIVNDDEAFTKLMNICMNETTFCRPKVQNDPAGRGYILYNVTNYDPSPVTGDAEETSFAVKAYPDTGLFIRMESSKPNCD